MKNTATNHSILVIGYGNPLREDDGVGWRVTERLAEQFGAQEISVITCHQLTPELADPVAHASLAIFIDASATAPPGRVDCEPVKLTQQTFHSLNHATAPAELLRSAQTIFGHSPRAYVLTIGGESFGFGDHLSASVARAVPEALRKIKDLIKAHEAELVSHA
jgi:hydrogenase maturation protease